MAHRKQRTEYPPGNSRVPVRRIAWNGVKLKPDVRIFFELNVVARGALEILINVDEVRMTNEGLCPIGTGFTVACEGLFSRVDVLGMCIAIPIASYFDGGRLRDTEEVFCEAIANSLARHASLEVEYFDASGKTPGFLQFTVIVEDQQPMVSTVAEIPFSETMGFFELLAEV